MTVPLCDDIRAIGIGRDVRSSEDVEKPVSLKRTRFGADGAQRGTAHLAFGWCRWCIVNGRGRHHVMQKPDVESLARIASGGDLAALNVLLVTVRPEVLRLCTRILSNREDAEEACQDTLHAVARNLPGFEGRSAFRTWLYRLAANRARSTYRRSGSRELTANVEVLSGMADARRTSVVAITRLDLLDAMGDLRAELAEAVTLRDLVGLSYGEIAVLQQVPEGTVKSRIHKARLQLRKRLGHDGDADPVVA
jgi:RNA polymerase sigma factor (sigma-70 family)